MPGARYDGQTNWYESFSSNEAMLAARASAVALLGSGSGRCLDLGCGTGRALPLLTASGWEVVGADVSADQLKVAEALADDAIRIVRADAHALPFADGEFDAAVSILTHTDFDDLGAAFGEAFRVLRPGSRFVYLGVHPCFANPFVARGAASEVDDAVAIIRPGYRARGWQEIPSDPESAKIRARVGINHVPLSDFLNAFIGAGFSMTRIEEPGSDDPPTFLSVVAVKPPGLLALG
jgi:SAM-dependent methyltransferase